MEKTKETSKILELRRLSTCYEGGAIMVLKVKAVGFAY